jgi:uncharacterized protein YqgC (DUF456 family)
MDPSLTPVLMWIGAIVLVVAGFAGAVIPALPGTPLVFCGLWLGALADNYVRVGKWTLILLAALALIALVLDFIASTLGAKRVGASPKAITGSLIGTFAGMFFGIPGLLLGPFVGAVVGELAAQGGLEQATRVGVATWMGLLLGAIAKLAISLTMLGVFAFAWFF